MLDVMSPRDLLSFPLEQVIDGADDIDNEGPTDMPLTPAHDTMSVNMATPRRRPSLAIHHSSSSPCTTPRQPSFSFNMPQPPIVTPSPFFPRLSPSPPPPLSTSSSMSSIASFSFASPVPSIASLPTELVAQILLSSEHPLACSHISRRMRAIALGTPSMWSNIQLCRTTTNAHPIPKLYLSRTTPSTPLNIVLAMAQNPATKKEWDEERLNGGWFGPKEMEEILAWLIPGSVMPMPDQSPNVSRNSSFSSMSTSSMDEVSASKTLRWAALTLICDTYAPIHTFLTHTSPFAAPLLESIMLTRANPYHAEVFPFHPPALRPSISLFSGGTLGAVKDLSLDGVHVNWDLLASQLCGVDGDGTSGLESLTMRCHPGEVRPSPAAFFSILRSGASTLKEVIVEGSGPILPSLAHHEVVQLPHVEQFKLFWYAASPSSGSVAGAASLLSSLRLPTLRKLELGDLSRDLEYQTVQNNGVYEDFVNAVHLCLGGREEGKAGLEEIWFTDIGGVGEDLWMRRLFGGEVMKSVNTLGAISGMGGIWTALAPVFAPITSTSATTEVQRPGPLPNLTDIFTHLTSSSGAVWPHSTPLHEDINGEAQHPKLLMLLALRHHYAVSQPQPQPQPHIARVHYHANEVERVPDWVLDRMSAYVEVRRWGEVHELEDGDEECMDDVDDADAEMMGDEDEDEAMEDEGVEWADFEDDLPLPFPFPYPAQTEEGNAAVAGGETHTTREYEDWDEDYEDDENPGCATASTSGTVTDVEECPTSAGGSEAEWEVDEGDDGEL